MNPRILLGSALLVTLAGTGPLFGKPAATALPKVDFGREVLPVLAENCFYCHGPDAGHRKADLRLDERESALDVIVPGKSTLSELVARITSTDPEVKMPVPASHKTLTPAEINLLIRWVDEGAEWGSHWSFTRLDRPVPPAIARKRGAARNPIDAFVLDHLAGTGLAPSREADRRTLIRRVTLDLTGLPPTPAEVGAFLADDSPTAYEQVVDRLLASPAYGERMAWDWLELARFADSNGYQGDLDRSMWPWRDWVVRAFNDNLPYDQFVRWQLAGDLLPDPSPDQKLATAFLRNHPINGEGGRLPEENRVEYVMDMAETTGTAFLGLTMTCARCHDHKFDPISQRDYYSLFAFFNQTPVTGEGGDPQGPPVLDLSTPDQKARLADLAARQSAEEKVLADFERTAFPRIEGSDPARFANLGPVGSTAAEVLAKPVASRKIFELMVLTRDFKASRPDYVAVVRQVEEARRTHDDFLRSMPRVMIMADQPEPRKTFVLSKGLYNQPDAAVTAATPAQLPPMPADAPRNRLGLAGWLVAADNPLTARVTINRVWQMFWGTGLVKTAEDFGRKGEIPRHAELLDWLATSFRDSGWDLKALVRTMVTSATYRQSSRLTPELHDRDPENRLLARGPRFRSPSWMLRDQALAAGGLLVPTRGGPPVKPYQPPGVWEEATFGKRKYVQDHGDALHRRSLYTFWRRIIAPAEFFDTASRNVCTVKPQRTNTPLHALTTLNNPTFVEAARALAQTVMLATHSDTRRADLAFERVLARPPSRLERKNLLAGLEQTAAEFRTDPAASVAWLSLGESPRDPALDPVRHAAWTAMCLAILNLDEALTKE